MATIYDAYGNPVDLKALRQEVAGPSLVGIRRPYTEHPARGLTPHRLARLLLESEEGDPSAYLALAEEMEEKDLNYRAQLGTRKLAVASLAPAVEAATDAKADQAAAELVREVLGWEGLQDVFTDVLDALGKGYSVCELLWDTAGPKWLPRQIVWRDPRWFIPDQVDLATIRLRDVGPPLVLPPFKFIVHKPKLKSGLPIRGGLARASAWAYLFANFGLKDWVAFLEIFGQPLRLGKYPDGSEPEQIAILKRAVQDIGSDAAAVVPQGMDIEFVETATKGGSSDAYERMLRYLDERVTLAVLGQTLTSGQTQGGGGSLALGQVHNEVRKDLMRADAVQLAATLNRDLVRPLVDLNLGPREHYPRIRFVIEEPEDIKGLTEALNILVPLGLEVEASVVRDKLGLPDPGKEAKLLTPAKPPAASPAPSAEPDPTAAQGRGGCTCGRCAHSTGAGADGGPDALDGLVEAALEDWTAQFQPMADPLVETINQATSLEDLKNRLRSVANQMDPARLANALAQASFTARAAGIGGMAPAPETEPHQVEG